MAWGKSMAWGGGTFKKTQSVVRHHTLSEQTESLNGAKQWRGIMGGQTLEIMLASAMVIIPMLALSVVLIVLVHNHLVPDNSSTYSTGNSTGIPLGSAYYIDYSATRLVFISSLSSTLATLLISAAMCLFSYPVAYYISRESDYNEGNSGKLPSPYQLGLLIKTLDGRLTALWFWATYAVAPKRKRLGLVPDLIKAVLMLASLALLAVLITLADWWLHVSTNSVQYLEVKPSDSFLDFNPGRGLNPTCLNGSNRRGGLPMPGCVTLGGVVNGAGGANPFKLVGYSEYLKTASNQSAINQVYMTKDMAILGPAYPPINVDFEATSFASSTRCHMATSLCYTQESSGAEPYLDADISFNCSVAVAGLNFTGNFSQLSGTTGTTAKKVDLTSSATYTNAFDGNNHGLGFRYFSNSTKNDPGFLPASLDNPELWWGLLFLLRYSDPTIDPEIVMQPAGESGGIMSCTTNLSEVKYHFSNGTLSVAHSNLMNNTAAVPFVTAMTSGFANEILHEGLISTATSAQKPSDLAAGFAITYDRAMMALLAGALVQRPPLGMLTSTQTLVTRVPKAPFLAVVILDVLYAVLGIALTAIALVATWSDKGIRDTQARLSVAAVVAESFESPALGDDAKGIDDLYAERRGLATRRVALSRRENGGRKYKQVVVRESVVKREES